MRVVLDTTALFGDLQLGSARSRVLLEGARALDYQVLVPAPVVEELRRQHREEVSKLLDEITGRTRKLSQLVDSSVLPKAKPLLDTELFAEIDRLVARLHKKTNLVVPPYPKVDHEKLAARAVHRKKPFQEKGRGYLDALIWFSVIEAMQGSKDPVAFVSANSDDFVEEGSLHPDLIADVEAEGLDRNRLSWFKTVDQFNAQHVLPHLPEATRYRFELEQGRADFKPREWAVQSLAANIAPDYLIETAVEKFTEKGRRIHSLRVLHVGSVQVTNARELKKGKMALSLYLECRVSFMVRHPPWRFVAHTKQRGEVERRFPARDHGHTEDIYVAVSMILGDGSQPEAVDVTGLGGRFGDMEVEQEGDDDF